MFATFGFGIELYQYVKAKHRVRPLEVNACVGLVREFAQCKIRLQ
jgi:hypothetical protein